MTAQSGTAEPSLLDGADPTPAILYAYDDLNSETYDLPDILRRAEALGFEVTSEVSPDPDGSGLRDVVEGAKVGGQKVILVPYGRSFGKFGPEGFVTQVGILESEGLHLVAVLESDIVDTRDPRFISTVRWTSGLRNSNISVRTKEWARDRKERGEKLGRSPRCASCDHSVFQKAGRPGHLRLGDRVDRCFHPGCNCGNYSPRNDALMGKKGKRSY